MATVLVVDDDALICSSIKDTLEAEGYQVVTAGNGREVLNLFQDPGFRPKLVLLDLMMPLMNGSQLRDIVGRDPSLQKIPIVTMSAFFGEQVAADPDMVLVKPFALDRLLEVVARHCRESA